MESKQPLKRKETGFFIIGGLLILLSLGSFWNIPSVLAFFCGAIIFPLINPWLSKKINLLERKGLKTVLAITGIFLLLIGAVIDASAPSKQDTIMIPADTDPCYFLPSASVIPTEFEIGEKEIVNGTCKQTYSQGAFGTAVTIELTLYPTISQAQSQYATIVSEEKANRGYTELRSEENCFTIRQESTLSSVVYHYCRWGNLYMKERIVESGWYSTSSLLEIIPEAVEKKIKNHGAS